MNAYNSSTLRLRPASIRHPINGPFLRRMARLRYRLRELLATGQMAHPPRFLTPLPTVTADWQWHGTWPVSITAIQSAAWRAPDGRIAVVFVNVTDKPQEATVQLRCEAWGLTAGTCTVRRITENGESSVPNIGDEDAIPMQLKPCDAWAWVVRAGKG